MTDRVDRAGNDGTPRRVAVLAAGPTTGVQGGAERFYRGLIGGLSAVGCAAELVSVPADEPSFDAIIANYERCAQLDLSGFDVVISTKAPTFAIDHPRHVMYLVHTVRVFDDMFTRVFPNPSKELYVQRSRLHALDFAAMRRARARFAIGHEVAHRLYRWRGLDAQVLHPPLGIEGFRNGPPGDYFFLPGRLHDWKRVHLVIEAVRLSSLPLRLLIAGTGEAEADLKKMAAGDPRIEFLGRVDDEALIDLYAGALAVPFTPEREDYGYITLEAFASGKAVVTCADSGEPTRFVRDGETGRICAPDPQSIREALEWLFHNPDQAGMMGARGREVVAHMSWPDVARRLLDAAYAPEPGAPAVRRTQVTVIDMQPIDPPVGGGRLRLLGLYHGLGEKIDCTYVGTYDWPGESYRRHRLSPGLEEIDIPLSDAHHQAAAQLARQAGGKTVIDLAFARQARLSPDYIAAARDAIQTADIVVFSHPWAFPLFERDIAPGQTLVYDSHNVEGFLRAQLLDERNPAEAELLRDVVETELRLCRRADLVLACSHEDLARFNRLYRVRADKLRVVPNGVMAFSHPVPDAEAKVAARTTLDVAHWGMIAIFLGSAYGPNVEAARFIIDSLAPSMPDVLFVIAGGVGAQLTPMRANVQITGPLDEAEKHQWLAAVDVAVNPMFSGSGTNIKMFDFMAAGLPTVTTAVGARGIKTGARRAMQVVDPSADEFVSALQALRDVETRGRLGLEARACVEDGYSWERISEFAGALFRARHRFAGQTLPTFSIVIPTYERHQHLDALISRLQAQIERDFEVIVVDQSAARWVGAERHYGFPMVYFRTPVKGALRARNTGASLASGTWVVVIGERDRPPEDWLFRLRKTFAADEEGELPVGGTSPAYAAINYPAPRLMARSEALQVAGGLGADAEIHDLAQPNELASRLRRFGNVKQSPLLGSDIPLANGPKAIVMLSTLGHKCGIGEYSGSLAQAFEEMGPDIHVLSCRSATAGAPPTAGLARSLLLGWFYDDIEFRNSGIYYAASAFVSAVKPILVIVQYHPAFFSAEELGRFTIDCINSGASVVIDNHRFRDEDASSLRYLETLGARVSLHRMSECNAARKHGLFATHTPLGTQNHLPFSPRSIEGRDWAQSPPRLVTTGFLRRHKGVQTLLRALPSIVEAFPGAVFRVQCAVYPSPDSTEELALCESLIDELHLRDHVVLDTVFHEKSRMLELIRDADVALLAYDHSEEGGSAAALDCLSVGLPLLVSSADIFEDLRGYAQVVNGDHSDWANKIKRVLRSPEEYSRLSEYAHKYVESHGWNNIAQNFLENRTKLNR
jgi:glycosyltransferase involved in cell wall biosynthesis